MVTGLCVLSRNPQYIFAVLLSNSYLFCCVKSLQAEQLSEYASAVFKNMELIQDLYDLFDESHEVIIFTYSTYS